MTLAVDLRRRMRARLPADPESADAREPGEMVPCPARGAVTSYLWCCPGCGEEMVLPLRGPDAWTVVAGDPREPSTLTLSPSLHHAEASCGWHGWLRAGELAPC